MNYPGERVEKARQLTRWFLWSENNAEVLKDPTSSTSQAKMAADQGKLAQYVELLKFRQGTIDNYRAEVSDLIQQQQTVNQQRNKARSDLYASLKKDENARDIAWLKEVHANSRAMLDAQQELTKLRSVYNDRLMAKVDAAYNSSTGTASDAVEAWDTLLGRIFEEGLLDAATTDPHLPAMMTQAVSRYGVLELDDDGAFTDESIERSDISPAAKSHARAMNERARAVVRQQRALQETISAAENLSVNGSDEQIQQALDKAPDALSALGSEVLETTAADGDAPIADLNAAVADYIESDEIQELNLALKNVMGFVSNLGSLKNEREYRRAFSEDSKTGDRSAFIEWAKERGFDENKLGASVDGGPYIPGPRDYLALVLYNREVSRGLGRYGRFRRRFTGDEVEVTQSIEDLREAKGRPAQIKLDGEYVDVASGGREGVSLDGLVTTMDHDGKSVLIYDDNRVVYADGTNVKPGDLESLSVTPVDLRVVVKGERLRREGTTHARHGDHVWVQDADGNRHLFGEGNTKFEINTLEEGGRQKRRRDQRKSERASRRISKLEMPESVEPTTPVVEPGAPEVPVQVDQVEVDQVEVEPSRRFDRIMARINEQRARRAGRQAGRQVGRQADSSDADLDLRSRQLRDVFSRQAGTSPAMLDDAPPAPDEGAADVSIQRGYRDLVDDEYKYRLHSDGRLEIIESPRRPGASPPLRVARGPEYDAIIRKYEASDESPMQSTMVVAERIIKDAKPSGEEASAKLSGTNRRAFFDYSGPEEWAAATGQDVDDYPSELAEQRKQIYEDARASPSQVAARGETPAEPDARSVEEVVDSIQDVSLEDPLKVESSMKRDSGSDVPAFVKLLRRKRKKKTDPELTETLTEIEEQYDEVDDLVEEE
jgi:hypothetical protein